MKKIIISAAVLVLSTFSANAIDMGKFSLTAGLSANQSVFGATAKEQNYDEAGTIRKTSKESGVFTDGYGSQFIELGIGQYVSFGYESSDTISTPQNVSKENMAAQATVSVDFENLTSTYAKINFPNGVFAKYGMTSVDLNIKETMLSGSTYKDQSTDGTALSVGYQTYIGDSNFGLRIEGAYLEFDGVGTSNGVATGDGTPANGGRYQVDASSLEGIEGKVSVTYTLGRNN
jgi:hypothetical protein